MHCEAITSSAEAISGPKGQSDAAQSSVGIKSYFQYSPFKLKVLKYYNIYFIKESNLGKVTFLDEK